MWGGSPIELPSESGRMLLRRCLRMYTFFGCCAPPLPSDCGEYVSSLTPAPAPTPLADVDAADVTPSSCGRRGDDAVADLRLLRASCAPETKTLYE